MAAEQHRRQSPVPPALPQPDNRILLQGSRAKAANSDIQTMCEGPMLEFNTLHSGMEEKGEGKKKKALEEIEP